MAQAPDIRTITITDLGFGGDGIARADGETIFVPYALPGDTVRVKITERKQQQTWARVLDVVTPSPDRVANPPCVHCFDCGGCQLQHMSMMSYQAWKYQSVLDRLEKAGLRAKNNHPLIAVPAQTRRRATFCAKREGRKVIVGFNRHHSDQVIDLSECHVVIEPITAILPGLRVLMDVLLDQTRTADIAVTQLDTGLDVLITGEIDLNLVKHEAIAEFVSTHDIARISLRTNERQDAEVVLQPKPAQIIVGGASIEPSMGSFLQPSLEGETALIAAVRAGLTGAKNIIDLFCGLGTFTFALAQSGIKVTGVDADGPGIRAAAKAKTTNNITFNARNLYREPLSAKELSAYDAVIFDPPRAGAKAQAPLIAQSGVPRVIAVSCNPGTFAQDCAHLSAAGYHFTDLYVVDQFTWSSHVEIVGVFVK